MLIQFFKSKHRSLFSIHDQIGVKLLWELQMTFGHLSKHKFCHKFKDCVSPMCNFGTEIKTINHFFFVLPVPSQWKTKSPWSLLPDRSFNYNLWWRISIKSFTLWFRFRIPKIVIKAQPHAMTYINSHPELFYKKGFLNFL